MRAKDWQGVAGMALFLFGAYTPMVTWYHEGPPPDLFTGMVVHGGYAFLAYVGMAMVVSSLEAPRD